MGEENLGGGNNELQYQNELYPQANKNVTGGIDPTTGMEVKGNPELNVPGSTSSIFEPLVNLGSSKQFSSVSTGNLTPDMPDNFRSISGADSYDETNNEDSLT